MTSGTGDPVQITEKANQAAKIALQSGDLHYHKGEFELALVHYLKALEHSPNQAELQVRAAMDYLGMESSAAAMPHLEQAIRLNPNHAQAHAMLANLLLFSADAKPALEHARRASELAPDDPDIAAGLATILEADRQSGEADRIVGRLLAEGKTTTRLALLCARLAPRRFAGPRVIEMIDRLLDEPELAKRERPPLLWAAASLLDRMRQYDQAFDYASRAYAIRGGTYDAKNVERIADSFIEYFSAKTLQRLPRASHGLETPVFIIGMPRSGTSLIEQILSSHPSVFGAGERDWVFRAWESATQKRGSINAPLTEAIDQLTQADLNDLAAQYLAASLGANPLAARVTDKTLGNFMHVGLIALLFPKARIIHCRRNPLDTCVSCYLGGFAADKSPQASLGSLGHYYRQHDRMMAHWKTVVQLPLLEVRYEEVVSDLDAQARRMVEFLGLPWDQRCLAFHESGRFVATASTDQVRRPIYSDSVDRWRNYAAHLTPLREALLAE